MHYVYQLLDWGYITSKHELQSMVAEMLILNGRQGFFGTKCVHYKTCVTSATLSAPQGMLSTNPSTDHSELLYVCVITLDRSSHKTCTYHFWYNVRSCDFDEFSSSFFLLHGMCQD